VLRNKSARVDRSGSNFLLASGKEGDVAPAGRSGRQSQRDRAWGAGHRYLRQMLVVGSMAVIRYAERGWAMQAITEALRANHATVGTWPVAPVPPHR